MAFTRQQKSYWQQQGGRRNPYHPAVAGFARPKIDFIKQCLPQVGDGTILEVGAGDGYLTHYLHTLGPVVAVDFSLPMLRDNGCDTRTVADATCLPFPARAFDTVVEANLLHHVPQPVQVVREMGRVSKGGVVLIEPNRWNPLMLALGVAKAEERKTLLMCASSLRRLIAEAGLELVGLVRQGFVTPNRMPVWLVHLLSRFERPSPWAAYVVAIGRRID